MAKRRSTAAVEHGRGTIHDNALAALVTGPLFQPRIERPKKGKGSYQRQRQRQRGDDAAFFYGPTSPQPL